MKRLAKLLAVTLAISPLVLPAANAQELKAEKRANVAYETVVMLKFKPGGAERAEKIVSDTFVPAARAANVSIPKIMHAQTGKWDMVIVFPMTGGMADMEYQNTPEDVKWIMQMAKQLGGQDKAFALLTEYESLVQEQDSFIVHEHKI